MPELRAGNPQRPDLHLTRRSLIAAAGIVAAVGPAAASRALAFGKPNPPRWNHGSSDCKSKCICFLHGTRLRVPHGEFAVENLKIGDLVSTVGGAERAIRWIGRIEFSRDAWSEDVLPVRIAKDALGAGRPHRHLYVSRAHMIYLDGLLIPAGDLINNSTITVETSDVEVLRYYHVELDGHDVVLAEGVPCESLLPTVENIQAFDNCDEYALVRGTDAVYAPYAPIVAFNGGWSEFRSRLRSALAPLIDIRHPMDIVRDRLEAQTLLDGPMKYV